MLKTQSRLGNLRVLSRVFALPSFILTLNILDVMSTQYGLALGLQEVNPLFSDAIVPGKFLGCLILFWPSFFANRLNSRVKICVDTILFCVSIFYTLVLANNILLIAMY